MGDAAMFREMFGGRTVLVGVGNPMKGDDGFGPLVANMVPGALDARTVPENFISRIRAERPDNVIVFDSLDFGGKPGEVRVVDAADAEGLAFSTHALPLSLFARMLAPAKVWLVGAQPASVGFGESASKEVKESAERIANQAKELLGRGRT
jgi:hydrogenase 3 maturation protease